MRAARREFLFFMELYGILKEAIATRGYGSEGAVESLTVQDYLAGRIKTMPSGHNAGPNDSGRLTLQGSDDATNPARHVCQAFTFTVHDM